MQTHAVSRGLVRQHILHVVGNITIVL